MGYGQIAYQAYLLSVGGLSVRGEKLPDWEHQDPKLQEAWNMAALAVAERVTGKPTVP